MRKYKSKCKRLEKIAQLKFSNEIGLPVINVKLKSNDVIAALLDSGASTSLISEKLYRELLDMGLIRKFTEAPVNCYGANGNQLNIMGKAIVNIKINNFTWNTKFLICEDLNYQMILGVNFIRDTQLVLDVSSNQCYFKFKPEVKINLNHTRAKVFQNANQINCGPDISLKYVENLISRYPNVFTKKIGKALDFEYEIKLKDKTPVNLKPYPLSPPRQKQLQEIIDSWLEQGIVKPVYSDYSSPCFLVPKPGSTESRLVINYSKLNEKIEKVAYPIGDLHDSYHHMQKARYFTCLDLSNSFLQIPLEEKCQKFTAFSTMNAMYCFNRLPYGLHMGSGI